MVLIQASAAKMILIIEMKINRMLFRYLLCDIISVHIFPKFTKKMKSWTLVSVYFSQSASRFSSLSLPQPTFCRGHVSPRGCRHCTGNLRLTTDVEGGHIAQLGQLCTSAEITQLTGPSLIRADLKMNSAKPSYRSLFLENFQSKKEGNEMAQICNLSLWDPQHAAPMLSPALSHYPQWVQQA